MGYTRERDKEQNESPSCEGCMGEDMENRGKSKTRRNEQPGERLKIC